MDHRSKVSVEFIYSMTSGSISRNGLLWQERWCVVMGGHLLHVELTVRRRCWSWWSCWVPVVENVVQFHHHCDLLGFHWKSPSLFNLDDSYYDNTRTTYNNYNSDNRVTGLFNNNFIQFIYLLTIFTQNQIPMRYTSDFPILPHYPPGTPRSLRKSNPTDRPAFAWGRTNPNRLP